MIDPLDILDFLKEIVIVAENVNPYFCLVKNAIKNIKNGIEQRDAGIKINGKQAESDLKYFQD